MFRPSRWQRRLQRQRTDFFRDEGTEEEQGEPFALERGSEYESEYESEYKSARSTTNGRGPLQRRVLRGIGASPFGPRTFSGACYLCKTPHHSQKYCPLRFCTTCSSFGHSSAVCTTGLWRDTQQ